MPTGYRKLFATEAMFDSLIRKRMLNKSLKSMFLQMEAVVLMSAHFIFSPFFLPLFLFLFKKTSVTIYNVFKGCNFLNHHTDTEELFQACT